MKRLTVGAAILSVVLSSCAHQQQGVWLKPGSSAGEFSQDRYACLQQSQQQASSAYIGRYGGFANSGAITNGQLFNACMNAKGYVLQQVADANSYREALKEAAAQQGSICSRAEFEVLFRKKMACKALQSSPEQLADRSKISNEEKIEIMKWRSFVAAYNEKISAINRQYDTKNGDALASLLEQATLNMTKLTTELYDGRISWGDFNRRRVELTKRYDEDLKATVSN